MYNEKNIFLTVSWLSGLLSAEIFISTGECGVQMPPLTSENSHFLRSGPQEATLVMLRFLAATKQLYEWYFLSVCPSVRLSVCHTFLTMFPSSYHHEIFRSYHIGPG